MAEAPRAGWPARAALAHHHRGPAATPPSPDSTTPDPNKSHVINTPLPLRRVSPAALVGGRLMAAWRKVSADSGRHPNACRDDGRLLPAGHTDARSAAVVQ